MQHTPPRDIFNAKKIILKLDLFMQSLKKIGKEMPKIESEKPIYNQGSKKALVRSGCRASGNFDIFSENYFFLIYVNNFCDAGQVPIFRYFEA